MDPLLLFLLNYFCMFHFLEEINLKWILLKKVGIPTWIHLSPEVSDKISFNCSYLLLTSSDFFHISAEGLFENITNLVLRLVSTYLPDLGIY